MNRMLTAVTPTLAGIALGAAAFGTAALAAPPTAQACGGFFCNNSQPVNQAAERIIFSKNGDGTVTAVIQIVYSGPSERFAWVLPVEGDPEVQVSSNVAFQRLQNRTNPQYQLTTTVEGTCRDGMGRLAVAPNARGGGAVDGGATAEDDGVTVVNQGSVGPYDYVVISLDAMTPEAADVAVQWLNDNDYDVTEMAGERLGPYLEAGMNLVAFRLTKGSDTGSIRPVMIRFGTGMPMIPIRPTAVAATEDMGVMVWVLGEHRAVPANYRSLELNEALIDWINPNRNYNDAVTAAADEAGGQGFVTEMAGPTAAPDDPNGSFADTVFSSAEQDSWQSTVDMDWTARHGELLNQVVNRFAMNQFAGPGGPGAGVPWDGIRDAIRETVPVPEGATLDDLFQCISCYYDWNTAEIAGFDPAAFLASVQANVIEPMEQTRALFESRPYVTRLYTTMSPDEMTMDPAFDFNPDLADYSNIHNAERIIECSPSVSQSEAPWRIELPNGDVIRGEGNAWPFDPADPDDSMPANSRILRVGDEGDGQVLEDNVSSISAALEDHNATVPGPATAGGGGCTIASRTAGRAGLTLAGLFGAALLVAGRRRRRARS